VTVTVVGTAASGALTVIVPEFVPSGSTARFRVTITLALASVPDVCERVAQATLQVAVHTSASLSDAPPLTMVSVLVVLSPAAQLRLVGETESTAGVDEGHPESADIRTDASTIPPIVLNAVTTLPPS